MQYIAKFSEIPDFGEMLLEFRLEVRTVFLPIISPNFVGIEGNPRSFLEAGVFLNDFHTSIHF